jgi:hypothetical protein
MLRREPVVHRERDESLLGEHLGDGLGELLAPDDPAAAVDHHDRGPQTASDREVGVELQLLAPDLAVRQVALHLDAVAGRLRGAGRGHGGGDADRERRDGDGDRRSPHALLLWVVVNRTLQSYPAAPDIPVSDARG